MSKSLIKIIVCVILCIPVCVNAQDYINYEKYQSLDSARIAKKKATRESVLELLNVETIEMERKKENNLRNTRE